MSNETITRSSFTAVEKAMQEAGFKPEKVKQEVSFAIQLINKNEQLRKCSHESLLQAVLNISNIGLSLNPAAKEAYLIPRYNRMTRGMEASLEPSYVGLVKLLTDAGSVTSILANWVHEGDHFEIDLANNKNPVIHRPERDKAKRGAMTEVYALATLPDGTRQVEYMTIDEVNEIRDRSETYKAYKEGKIQSCTWVTDFGEMGRKTVVKRLYKYCPRTEKMQRVDQAIYEDNKDFEASANQISYIETLLRVAEIDDRERDALEMECAVMNAERASKVIEYLLERQPSAISHVKSGRYASQAIINKAVKQAVEMPNT